jgi:hypothetical protein
MMEVGVDLRAYGCIMVIIAMDMVPIQAEYNVLYF